MNKVFRNALSVSYRLFIFAGILLTLLLWSAGANAQQPTATITALSGEVLVSIQGRSPVAAQAGTALKRGDSIQTQAGARVMLKLSDGSELQIGEDTKLDIAILSREPATEKRVSRVKLAWGRVQAFLSPEHQKKGSSFDFETPNALVGVKFSQPDVEVSYDPETKTTIVRAYTVAVTVINLTTQAEIESMPKGHQAIIRDEFIVVSKITQLSKIFDQMKGTAQEEEVLPSTDLLLETRRSAAGSISSAPKSAKTSSPGTSQQPIPGASSSGDKTSPVGYTLTISEE